MSDPASNDSYRWTRPHFKPKLAGEDGHPIDWRFHAVARSTNRPACGARVEPYDPSTGYDEKPPRIANRRGHENPICDDCVQAVATDTTQQEAPSHD